MEAFTTETGFGNAYEELEFDHTALEQSCRQRWLKTWDILSTIICPDPISPWRLPPSHQQSLFLPSRFLEKKGKDLERRKRNASLTPSFPAARRPSRQLRRGRGAHPQGRRRGVPPRRAARVPPHVVGARGPGLRRRVRRVRGVPRALPGARARARHRHRAGDHLRGAPGHGARAGAGGRGWGAAEGEGASE